KNWVPLLNAICQFKAQNHRAKQRKESIHETVMRRFPLQYLFAYQRLQSSSSLLEAYVPFPTVILYGNGITHQMTLRLFWTTSERSKRIR
ncbi:Uncharacterized protein APZ42_029802, partial [Daphnia magna]